MRTTVHKWFWAWNFEGEEKWLNEMAAKGLTLVSVGWCRYDFEKTDPGEYRVAMEMLEHRPNHPESVNYLEFLEDTGVEMVGSYMRWVYFRKKAADGEFELFSDYPSRIKHLARILWLLGILAGCNFYAALYNLFCWFQWHETISLVGSLISFTMTALLTYGIVRIGIKARRMKKEMQIYE